MRLYLFIIFFIAFWIGFIYFFPVVFPISFNFGPQIHDFIESLMTITTFLIFLKANHLYSKTGDKRMAILAGGFLTGTLLGILNIFLVFSFPYDIITIENLHNKPGVFFSLIKRLILASSLFMTIFYPAQKIPEEKNNFRKNTYSVYLFIFILVIIFDLLLTPSSSTITYETSFLIFGQDINILDIVLYLLTAFIYINIKIDQKKSLISNFVIGLFILLAGNCFFLSSILSPFIGFLANSMRFAGYLLVLLGLDELNQMPRSISIKDKLLAYISLTLISFYIIFVTICSIFGIRFPSFAPFIFLEFIIILSFIQSMLFTRFITPVTSIIKTIEKYKPEQEPEKIPVISNDEIGVLAERLNTIIDENWSHTKELLNRQTKIQELADKEGTLLKITEAIKSTFDLNHILDIICQELLNIFKSDKAVIASYNEELKTWEFLSECQTKIDLFEIKNFKFPIETENFITQTVFEEGKDIIIDNLKESEFIDYFKNSHLKLGVKSMVIIPIKKENEKWGAIGLFQTEYHRKWNQGEIDFLHKIANQTFIALRQAELFTTTKNQADRAELIRKIIAAIGETLDLEKVLNIIGKEVLDLFKFDRVSMVSYVKGTNYAEWSITSEVKSNPDLLGINDITYPTESKKFIFSTVLDENRDIIIDDIDKLDKSDFPDYFIDTTKMLHIKSYAIIPIKKGDDKWGVMGFSQVNSYRTWTKDEIQLLHMIADQAYIAIRQAELYTIVKNQANRETLLREMISTIRSTLDLDEVTKNIVTVIGKAFKADRCYLRIFDKKTNKYLPTTEHSEYLSSPDIESLIHVEPIQEAINVLGEMTLKKGLLTIEDTEDFLKKNNLENTRVQEYFKNQKIKSLYALPVSITEDEESIIFLVFHYTRERVKLTSENYEFFKILTEQLSIALYQVKLYTTVKENAERERILREIITNIKASESIGRVYNYLIYKLADIFNSDRVIFVENQALKLENPEIKYECLKNNELYPITKVKIPKFFTNTLLQIEENLEPLIINNVHDFYKDNKEAESYFKYFDISSILAIPLVRYNHEVKILGVLVLCSSEPKKWTQQEILLLNAIIDSVVTIIWEITKLVEIDELRNTFILTLAYDVQVPLVGQQKALEYLAARQANEPIGRYVDFINQTIESNKKLFNRLANLLDSYQYESGSKRLAIKSHNISEILNETVNELSESAKSKFMTINIDCEQDIPDVLVDKTEIKKVVNIILDNAINYTQENGNIDIKSYRENDRLITCIRDNGPGITPDMRERIFQRYAMAQIIERKIGTGLGLFLAKQIVDAHDGDIWFETEEGKGSNFCFSLPIA